MHLGECNGFVCTILGGVLALALRKRALGGTQAERLAHFNAFREEWYRNNPPTNRLPALRPGNLVSDGWYELSGNAVKAANTRCAIPLFRDYVAQKFLGTTGAEPKLRKVTVQLSELYDMLYSSPMLVADADVARLRAVCLDLGVLVMELREYCRTVNLLAFRVVPKMHRLQHLPLYAEVLNPRHVHNYGEESLIGTTTQVWQRAMRGRYKVEAQSNVLLRRTLGLFLRLEIGSIVQ